VTDRIGAILVAAGESSRMGGLDKVFAPLLGKPLVAHALDALAAVPGFADLVLVLSTGALERGRRLLAAGPWPAAWRVCEGGPRRQDSVRCGLEALGDVDWVVVHDAARPCAEPALVVSVLDAARETGAAAAAVRVTDTIKVVDAGGTVVETPNRERLWASQTPQAFRRSLLARAHARSGADATDDAALVERLGHAVRVAPGAASNLKVTTPDDLVLVEAVLRRRATPNG
jgi:2-C-methyl-D-erythritol 4-phosphate cytidylyltransferase